MTGMNNIFYFSIINTAILLSALGMWFTLIIPGLDRWSKRFFLSYFIIFLLCCISGNIETAYLHHRGLDAAFYIILFTESLLLSLPLPMLTVYLLHCCGESIRASRLMHIVAGLWGVFLVILFASQFLGVVRFVKSENQYYRGPRYWLLMLPMVAILLLTLAGTIRRRKYFSHKTFLSFLTAILPMTAALVTLMFVDCLPVFCISFVLSAIAMYGFILSDQIEQDLQRQREIARQQQEIANQRASIMVLQMRPHFIYNTMTSIYCLCDQDPQLARQVVMDFTTYLRKNFTAIASSAPIPFSSELEHIRAYLSVEQTLYEDSLFVDYDTPHTRFRVPPLTLQPIVENAVKHGRDPCAGPFHISIQTKKTASASEVVIADNGRGFDFDEDSESHFALKNIRQRLEIMCGGSLTITPGDGGGTVVTILIPDSPL